MSDDCDGYYDEKCCATLNYIQSKRNNKQNLPTPPVDTEIWWVVIAKKANKSMAEPPSESDDRWMWLPKR